MYIIQSGKEEETGMHSCRFVGAPLVATNALQKIFQANRTRGRPRIRKHQEVEREVDREEWSAGRAERQIVFRGCSEAADGGIAPSSQRSRHNLAW